MAKIAINIATGSLQQEDIIVGIDLGTTNSLIAFIHPETKKPIALKEHNSSSLVPSIIHFDNNGENIVGNNAKEYLISHPTNTIYSIKRLLGKTYNDVALHANFLGYKIIDDNDKMVKVQVNNSFYSPIDLSSLILKELKKQAEHILKTTVSKAVITVPAYFNDEQRQATRDAGKLAGLDVLRIISEPTAASLAYGFGLNNNENKNIAIYDLGGGTFDISILTINDGVFDVLSTNGDTYLGGDDVDIAIVDYWITKNNLTNTDINYNQILRLYAQQAKIHLSNNDIFISNYQNIKLILDKNEFEEIILPIINKTIICCENALKDSGLQKNVIDEIIMVGGSTRIPLVKKMVSNFFEKNVNDSLNPDEVVALGAAIQADVLAGNTKNILLLDVTPLSLGIETMGGLMDVLLPRNSKIPTSATRQYTTYKDGQTGIIIKIYQGERDLVNDNRKLAEFILSGIPSMPTGFPKVNVSFIINADGILVVKAKEVRSGIEQIINIKPKEELTDERLEQMLLDSIQNAEKDVAQRALIEAKTEAEQLLQTTEKFITKNITLLTQNEINTTTLALQSLQMAVQMNEKNIIQLKIEELNNISKSYAERVMDKAISVAMKGTKI